MRALVDTCLLCSVPRDLGPADCEEEARAAWSSEPAVRALCKVWGRERGTNQDRRIEEHWREGEKREIELR